MFRSQRTRLFALSAIAAFVVAAPSFAETVEEVMEKVGKAHEATNSFKAKMIQKQDMTMPAGTVKSSSDGVYAWKRDGEKLKYRMDMKTNQTMDFGGQKMEHSGTTQLVCDGEFIYTLNDMNGQKTAMKTKVTQESSGDPKDMLKALEDDWMMLVKPETEVDGRDCYVIEANVKEKPQMGPTRQVYHFDKKTGANIMVAMFDHEGNEIMTVKFTDIEIDPKLDDAQFKFEAPEGVEVMDMSGMGAGMGAPSGTE